MPKSPTEDYNIYELIKPVISLQTYFHCTVLRHHAIPRSQVPVHKLFSFNVFHAIGDLYSHVSKRWDVQNAWKFCVVFIAASGKWPIFSQKCFQITVGHQFLILRKEGFYFDEIDKGVLYKRSLKGLYEIPCKSLRIVGF
jgi:hypothetical protein